MNVRIIATAILISAPFWALSQSYEKVTDQVVATDGGDSRSVNWIDVEGDGDLDLYVSNGHSPAENNFMYLNQGNGSFTKVSDWAIVQENGRSDGTSWGDVDNDGDLDVYIANWYNDQNLMYLNTGDGFERFTTSPLGTARGLSESCAWGDYDNDGDLDLYVANSGSSNGTPNFFFTNNGDGSFTKEDNHPIVAARNFARVATWIDADGDGDLDLYVANESATRNEFYRNNLVPTGSATFEAVSDGAHVTSVRSSISASWADYDNDGDFDLFVANLEQDNELFRNDNGQFIAVADIVSQDGGLSFGSSWGDIDNDGDLDLFVANGWGTGPQNNALYLNQLMESGSASFVKVTDSPIVSDGGWSYGSSFADYDEDGDLDLFVAKWMNSESENNALFRNLGNADHALQINFQGTISNRTAIGVIVCLKATIDGTQVKMTRQISGQDSYCGQNLRIHFGLGSATSVEEIEVVWPSGIRQSFSNIASDQVLDIVESQSQAPTLGSRWLTHLTRPEGGFSTSLRLWNTDQQPHQFLLHAYDSNGQFLTSETFEVGAQGRQNHDAATLFPGASWLNMDAPDSCLLTAAYASTTGVGPTAEANAGAETGTGFWIYASDWSLVFDGLAVVNVSEETATLKLEQWHPNGDLLKTTQLADLAAGHKQLVVLSEQLESVPGSLVKLTSSVPASALFLRGTYPGQSPAVLYTVSPIQVLNE